MKPSPYFFVGLGIFFVVALVGWFVGLQAIGQYLWHLLNGLSHL